MPEVARRAARKKITKKSADAKREQPRLEADVSMLESYVGYNLRRAAAKQRERFRSVFERFDIRPAQLTILAVILENTPVSQAAVGRALEIKRANVVTLLDELEKRGLVVRKPADHDRRSHVLHLTPRGKTLTEKLLAQHNKLENDLAKSLGPKELSTLVDLLRRFRRLDSAPKLR